MDNHTMDLTVTLIVASIIAVILYETARILWYSRRAVRAGKRVRPVERTLDTADMQVLIIGDSTALGTGARDQQLSLAGRMAADFPNIAIVNASENAMNIMRLREKLTMLNAQRFDIIMIHIGGIDAITFTPFGSLVRNLKSIIETACTMSRQKVFIISVNNVGCAPIFRFPLYKLFDRRSRMLSGIFSNLCSKEQVVHIPLYKKREEDPLFKERERLYASDGIHPNDEGYGYWYDKIKRETAPFLSKQ